MTLFGRQKSLGPDLSWPPPIYRPPGPPPHTLMNVLKLIIALAQISSRLAKGEENRLKYKHMDGP